MRLPVLLHPWRLKPAAAVELQQRLAALVNILPPRGPLWRVAGIDCAFSPDGKWCYAVVVLWDLRVRRAVEFRAARRRVRFPYVPGLLSFREAPSVLAALRGLSGRPDVLLCDGHGLAHPRRFGLACHLGLLAGIPSVGCAKSRLVGVDQEPGSARGSAIPVVLQGREVGSILRTREGVRPVHVSPGHLMDVRAANALVLGCGAGYRLPEPTRLADQWVGLVSRRCGLERQPVQGS